MDHALLRIGTVSRATGMAVSTLRSWENRYGLPTPARTTGGHRLYAREAVEQVRAVQSLVTGGASTAAAAALVLSRGPVDPAAMEPGGMPVAAPTAAPEGTTGHAVPLEELLIRTRSAKAEAHRLRGELTSATAAATALLGTLKARARQLQNS